jgi:MFS family permease
VLLLLNGLLYVIGETVTAFARENPPYDYGAHLVSDLGAQVCGEFQGRRRCSPLYLLMNITFITLGAVLFAAILLLARLLGRRARVHILFAALFAIGMLGVGLVQSLAATIANGTAVIHVVGSCIAMIVANVMAIVVGVQSRHAGAPLVSGHEHRHGRDRPRRVHRRRGDRGRCGDRGHRPRRHP